MAHEYLDLRFTRLRRFIDSDVRIIRAVIDATRTWIDPPEEQEEPDADG